MPAKQKTAPLNHGQTFNAIIAAYRVMHRRISEMVAEEGLTQPQFQALRIVARTGGTSMREISSQLMVTPANVTGIVDRLESRGLITRGAHKTDRRTTIIELTPRGNALQERMTAKYRDFMQDALGVLSEEEQAALTNLLVKLQKGMTRQEG